MYKDYLSLSQAGGPLHQRHLSSVTNHGQVVAVGGTWIAPQDLIASENFELLSTLAHSTLQVVRGNVGLATSGKVATASIDHTARLWSIETGECLMSFLGHEDQVMSVAFSPDGELLATASTDKTAKLWLCDSGQCAVTCANGSGRPPCCVSTILSLFLRLAIQALYTRPFFRQMAATC
eukprot:g29551.t1